MALTESEAKVLGALANLTPPHALTARQLCRAAGLCETSIHRALLRLTRRGLSVTVPQGPARWRLTDRGRVAVMRPVYREYVDSATTQP